MSSNNFISNSYFYKKFGAVKIEVNFFAKEKSGKE